MDERAPESHFSFGPRPSLGHRLLRAIGGLMLGWVWSSFIALGWCGLGVIFYGDIEPALDAIRSSGLREIVIGGYFASVSGSWLGSGIGPAVLGPSKGIRRPLWRSSFYGALFGGTLATVNGMAVGWSCNRSNPSVEKPMTASKDIIPLRCERKKD